MGKAKEVIGYLSGPVDGPAVYAKWKAGEALDYFGTSYLSQFLTVVRDRGARPVIVTYNDQPDSRIEVDDAVFYNIRRFEYPGLGYHRDVIQRIRRSADVMIDEGAATVVMTESSPYWFAARKMGRRGTKLLPALHGQLWSTHRAKRLTHRILEWFNGRWFFRPFVRQTIVASDAIARQVEQITERLRPQPQVFLPTYDPAAFAAIPAPVRGPSEPFRILVAGRIEADKGVFDMIAAGQWMKRRGLDFEFHFCGEGTALAAAKHEAAEVDLSNQFVFHGFCKRDELITMFGRSHAVAVPTRLELEEGFAMIVAEAVLAGRPVVTSRVCPALAYVRPAAVEVPPDDVAAYAAAFERLMTDRDFYDAKVAATRQCQAQFYDPANSYGAKLAEALDALG